MLLNLRNLNIIKNVNYKIIPLLSPLYSYLLHK